MSLLVWLPLHGNLNNQGLSDATFSVKNNSGAISALSEGKTAQACYARTKTATADYVGSNINFTLDEDFSMCCWCKITAIGNSSSANGIITQHGHNSGGPGITVKYISATDFRMSLNTGSTSANRTYITYYSTTNIYGDWHHLCATYKKSTQEYKMYIDGKLETIVGYGTSITAPNSGTARPFCLFAWSTDHLGNGDYRPACQLNDVRLYDHCLSAKEVKMVSQGLIAHYKLDQSHCTNILPKGSESFTGTTGHGTLGEGPFGSISKGYDNTAATSGYKEICQWGSAVTVSANQTYTVNFYARSENSSNMIVYFWNNSTGVQVKSVQASTGFTGSGSDGNCTITLTPEWKHYVIVWTFNSHATSLAKNLLFRVTAGNKAEIALVKLERGAVAQPSYGLNALEAPLDYGQDCSGYGHHGKAVGSLDRVQDPARNIGCTEFSGGYINCGRGPMAKDAITVNWWGYMSNWTAYTRAISCTEGGGWNFEPASSGTKINFVCGTGTSSNTYKSAISTTTLTALGSGWHMFTGTYDGKLTKIYIDGKLDTTINSYTTKTPIFYNSTNSIFIGAEAASSSELPADTRFAGKLSDVRIYCTALSAEDILTLYNTGASVSSDGTLSAYCFKEEPTFTYVKAQKSGVFNAESFCERGILGDVEYTTLPDGSAWGRIFYHNSKGGTVVFSSPSEAMRCNSADKFSCLYLLDSLKGKDGKYEFMLTYPKEYPSQFNRWKQTANPCTTYVGGTDGSANAPGYAAVDIDWTSNYWGGIGLQNPDASTKSACLISGSTGHGNWFYAIGAYEAWSSGIPGTNSTAVQVVELWVRLDTLNLNDSFKILNNNEIITTRLYEI